MGAAQSRTVIRERYRLDVMIGEGGMAEVWRAWDLTLERSIAVKLLFARESHTEEGQVELFLREARIAASVQHRNVIHIVDFGTTSDGQPFMVMELLEGETLAARMRRQKPLPIDDVVQIGQLTLRGLAAVHAAGIVHRDLKPENVYLKDEGGVVYPKILDFGISRFIDRMASSAAPGGHVTRDGVIVGTPEYMSPEQARGVKQLGYRTDLYSMGVVLYEALTGKLPYTSENVGDLIVKIVTGCAIPVHELAPSVPRALSDVVTRAMSRLPSDRFADATEMQEALLDANSGRQSASAPMFSDLPPEPSGAGHVLRLPRSSPRPAHTLPRTQAVRLQMLAPANLIEARPFATTPPPQAPSVVPGAITNRGYPISPPPPAAGHTLPIGEPSVAPSPPPAAVESSESASAALPSEHAPATLSESTGLALVSVGPPAWQVHSPRQWLVPGIASVTLLAVGVLTLWLAPHERGALSHASSPATRAAPPASKPALPAQVTLTLSGVPADASITLDGLPVSTIVALTRGEQPHSVAVLAKGKQPWHVSYVPNADQTLDVVLIDAPVNPPLPAAHGKRPAGKSHPHRVQGVLRVPDF